MEELVNGARNKMMQTLKHLIKKEFENWIKGFGFSRSRDTKIFREMEFEYLAKTLISL
jgi:hypothetical protein